MRNEGRIERILQSLISLSFLLGGIFLAEGKMQIILIGLFAIIATFAFIGFCPLYKILGINRYRK